MSRYIALIAFLLWISQIALHGLFADYLALDQTSKLAAETVIIFVMYFILTNLFSYKIKFSKSTIILGIAFGFCLFGIFNLYNMISAWLYSANIISVDYSPYSSSNVISRDIILPEKDALIEKISTLFIPIVLAPIFEEIVYRCFLYNGLKIKINLTLSITIVAIAFAVQHSPDKYLIFGIFSVLLCILIDKYRSLSLNIFSHITYNVIIIVNVHLYNLGYVHNFRKDTVFILNQWLFEGALGIISIVMIVLILSAKTRYFSNSVAQDLRFNKSE